MEFRNRMKLIPKTELVSQCSISRNRMYSQTTREKIVSESSKYRHENKGNLICEKKMKVFTAYR